MILGSSPSAWGLHRAYKSTPAPNKCPYKGRLPEMQELMTL